MNNSESMASKNLDKANKLYAIGLKNIKLPMMMLGTEFVVLRPKDNSKWKNVFGGSYSSESTLENDYEQFTTKLIVNMNEMRDVWNRNRDVLESYTPDGSLQVGDELQYTRDKRTYRFKISMKQAYSEAAEGLYVYTLSSIIETLEE
jgi:hypothetical protein